MTDITNTQAFKDALAAAAKDRADWLLDAVACATQDRHFLRGEPEYDEETGGAILLNAEKAIRVAVEHLTPAIEAAAIEKADTALSAALPEIRREAWQPIETAPVMEWVLVGRTGAPLPVAARQIRDGSWWDYQGNPLRRGNEPTHWQALQPLPEPPAAKGTEHE